MISKLVITVGKKNIELTEEEARELQRDLSSFLRTKKKYVSWSDKISSKYGSVYWDGRTYSGGMI